MKTYTITGFPANSESSLVFALAVDEEVQKEVFRTSFKVDDVNEYEDYYGGIDFRVNGCGFNAKIASSGSINFNEHTTECIYGKCIINPKAEYISVIYNGYLCWLSVEDINTTQITNRYHDVVRLLRKSKNFPGTSYIDPNEFLNVAKNKKQVIELDVDTRNYYLAQHRIYNELRLNRASMDATINALQPEYLNRYNTNFEFIRKIS